MAANTPVWGRLILFYTFSKKKLKFTRVKSSQINFRAVPILQGGAETYSMQNIWGGEGVRNVFRPGRGGKNLESGHIFFPINHFIKSWQVFFVYHCQIENAVDSQNKIYRKCSILTRIHLNWFG